jgi:excisionase family DNA binding protein
MSRTHNQATVIRPDERLALRVNDAALMAGLGRSSIYKLIDNGRLRSTKVGGRRLILRESLQQLLQAGVAQ